MKVVATFKDGTTMEIIISEAAMLSLLGPKDSMRTKQKVHPCNGREWLVKGIPSYVRIVDEDGFFPTTHGQAWICEHLLELD